MNSPRGDRPMAESLELFDRMRQWMIEEGKATLRMKQGMPSDKYNMYDLTAFCIMASAKLWTWCSLHTRNYSLFKGLAFFYCSSLPLIQSQGTSVYLSKLWFSSLHCRFSWKYYKFGMFLACFLLLLRSLYYISGCFSCLHFILVYYKWLSIFWKKITSVYWNNH